MFKQAIRDGDNNKVARMYMGGHVDHVALMTMIKYGRADALRVCLLGVRVLPNALLSENHTIYCLLRWRQSLPEMAPDENVKIYIGKLFERYECSKARKIILDLVAMWSECEEVEFELIAKMIKDVYDALPSHEKLVHFWPEQHHKKHLLSACAYHVIYLGDHTAELFEKDAIYRAIARSKLSSSIYTH